MQSDKGVVSGAKQVRRYRESLLDNQVTPFQAGRGQKYRAEQEGQAPGHIECRASSFPQIVHGQMDRETARQETDRAKNRKLEHLARRGPAQALAEIEQIGDDEDGE